MKVLITGITGFAGKHLAEFLRSEGVEVSGLDLQPAPPEFTQRSSEAPPAVHCCDLADAGRVAEVLGEERPDAVVHLAARAQVAGAWENAAAIMQSNAVCTQSLMQAIHETVPQARVLLISSSEVYGKVPPEQMPIGEAAPLKPNNPYSASKAAQEFIGLQYFHAFGAPVIIARPFNHIGPGQAPQFLVSAIAKRIVEAQKAGAGHIEVGNLDAVRDFLDVRDVVRAYVDLAERGTSGEVYNIASGVGNRVSDVVQRMIELAEAAVEVVVSPELVRTIEVPELVGDRSKITREVGFDPAFSLDATLRDVLEFWRSR